MTATLRAPAPSRRRAPARPARPAAPRRAPLRVVPQTRRRRFRLMVTAVVAFTLVAVFGMVAFNVFLVQSQFQLERLEQQVVDERQEFEQLRLDVARLSSPERILKIARKDLGLVDPASITYLTAPSESAGSGSGVEAARHWAEVKPYLAARP